MAAGGPANQQLLHDMLPWLDHHCSSNNNYNNQSSCSTTTTASMWMTPTATTPTMNTKPMAILIHDTLETSGRFLLYLTAREEVTKRQARVLWLTCTATQNQRLIEQGLSKIMEGKGGGGIATRTNVRTTSNTNNNNNNNQKSNITIRCIHQEISEEIVSKSQTDQVFSPEDYVRQIYRSVVSWCEDRSSSSSGSHETPIYIFLEDVSALANLVGPRHAYTLVWQIHSLKLKSMRGKNARRGLVSFVVTCSGDEPTPSPLWVAGGAGGQQLIPETTYYSSMPSVVGGHGWECSLVELANWVVDVMPLTTGVSRNVHGRLILTPRNIMSDAVVINYCLGENQVWATRIQTSTTRF